MERVRSNRKAHEIADALMERIAAGGYCDGDRLASERECAIEFEVGRSTIREAMALLEAHNLVEIRLGSGAYVRRPQAARRADAAVNLFDVIELRLVLQGEAAALAATRITASEIEHLRQIVRSPDRSSGADGQGGTARAIGLAVARFSHNSLLCRFVEMLWDADGPVSHDFGLPDIGPTSLARQMVAAFEALLEAFETRQPAAARAAMRASLDITFEKAVSVEESRAFDAIRNLMLAHRNRL